MKQVWFASAPFEEAAHALVADDGHRSLQYACGVNNPNTILSVRCGLTREQEKMKEKKMMMMKKCTLCQGGWGRYRRRSWARRPW
jgi:hypothetical protein